MYYIYLLKSSIKNWYYVGFTNSIINRIKKHNLLQVRSTKAYTPLKIVYYEAYLSKKLARKRELELKNNNQQREILYKRLNII